MASGKLLARMIVQSGAWIVFMAVLLFWPAGNWLWPEAWAFLIIFTVGSILFCAWLWRRDPALLESRMSHLKQKGQSLWDRVFMGFVLVGWNVWLVLMALDAQRWHASHIPSWLEAAGALLIVAGFADTGPYAVVRHPMYAAGLLYLVGMPLLLGSWYGLIGTALIAIGIAWRASKEESVLRRDLAGYGAYMARVRWRLLPHVW
jgi:protein-S-isoprenylcysteine O-methyltransferase Ste14